MKIISKFKDYYDGAMALGIDETIHYLRTTSEDKISDELMGILSPKKSWTDLNYKYNTGVKYNNRNVESYNTKFLFFCGRVYPVVFYSYKLEERYGMTTKTNKILGYDVCLDFFKQLKEKGGWRFSNEYELYQNVLSKLTSKIILDEHLKHKSPILLYSLNGQVTINPNLKELEFYKLIDTFTTFQEIGMFLGSTLCDVSTPKMPVGDDKVLIKSKGFDPKYGFRKRPNKKKLKKT